MEDLKKLGWMIFNVIVYALWISLIYYIDKTTGLNEVNSMIYIIFNLLISWVGGIFVIVYVQDFVQKKIN
jgi:hypothetical protein